MDGDYVADLPEMPKTHFTLEDLEEINRDMDSIMRLMDSMSDTEQPPDSGPRLSSNIYPLRPDIELPVMEPPETKNMVNNHL